MATEYKIIIENKSGGQKNYVIFNEPPKINAKIDENVWANVFTTHPTPPGQTAEFTISTQYTAVVGTANKTIGEGVRVSCGQPMPVVLGTANSNGDLLAKGTTYSMFVDKGAPQFKQNPLEPSGSINAFEIRTNDTFTREDAVGGNFLVGLGGDPEGTGLDGPAATFVPDPMTSYQIEPVKKYWVTTSEYKAGSLIKVASVATQKVAVDFSTLGQREAKIVHNPKSHLDIQSQR